MRHLTKVVSKQVVDDYGSKVVTYPPSRMMIRAVSCLGLVKRSKALLGSNLARDNQVTAEE
jgi:hypothetical protein